MLRVGPFCHGEVYLGGIPEWIVDKAAADPAQYALRTPAPGFVAAVSRFYDAIGEQARGLLWKDGGPVIGVQVDNESSGPWPYFAALKQAIIDAIKGMDAFEGITGSYTFNETNDPVKSVAVIKLSGGNEEFDSFF